MDIFEGLKLAYSLAKKTANLDLQKALVEAERRLYEFEKENFELKKENDALRVTKDIEKDIEYYEYPFIMRKSDQKPIKYCAVCWQTKHVLIPIQSVMYDNYDCPLCGAHIVDMRNWSENEK